MATFLARRWFLILLLGGFAAAWSFPRELGQFVSPLDTRLFVAIALFLMALGLEARRLLDAAIRPWPALAAVAVGYGLMPILGWLGGRLLGEPDLRIGLLIMTCVPCTLTSAALYTRLAGGNEAAALIVVLLTTATSWLITPAWLTVLTDVAGLDTGAMMRGLFLVLIVPVAVAQAARSRAVVRSAVVRLRGPLGVACQILIFCVMLQAVVEVRRRIDDSVMTLGFGTLGLAALVCIGVHLAALTAGFGLGTVLGFDRSNRIAVAFAGSQKTLPVALFLFHAYFKDSHPLAVASLAFYHVGQLVTDTFIADWLVRRTTGLDLANIRPPAANEGGMA